MIEKYHSTEPLSIGNTEEISISSIAKIICDRLDFDFDKVIWDTSKPKGQYRKPSCNKQLLHKNEKVSYTDVADGIDQVCTWFLKKYPDIRGISK